MTPPAKISCDECGSPFFSGTSAMESLCPECAHWLYGKPNCDHAMAGGRCTHCGWDGSVSKYVASLKAE